MDDDALWTGDQGLDAAAERVRGALAAAPAPAALVVDSLAALAAASGGPESPSFLAFLARSVLGAGAATVAVRGDGLPRGGRARAALAASATSLLTLDPLPSGAAPDVAAVLTAARVGEAAWGGKGGGGMEGGGERDGTPASASFSVRGADARLAPRPAAL